jgi:antitoxin component YwqK of YwqJK toxin-antitoxin module
MPKLIPAIVVQKFDTSLHCKNGLWYFHDSLFSGRIEEKYISGQQKSIGSFYHGKEEGCSFSFYPDGKRESVRSYDNGEKCGTHTGWWNNDKTRFEYHFTKGNYDGDYFEWYTSGKLLKHIIYKNGEELSGKGWRENGKLFMNYVMKDKRRYGLMNAQLCYSLKSEEGEWVRSKTDSLKN